MNTSAAAAVQYSSESWSLSRRGSVETILSIQDKETDFVCDSSDTEVLSDDLRELEYEPFTEPEDDAPAAFGDSSGESANEIISTKVIAVSVRDDGDLEFADSELTDTDGFDSEVDLCDYWRCCQCGASNNNPLYRYCERCYKVRKNFFPPRPKRKNKRKLTDQKDSRSTKSGDESHERDRLHLLSQDDQEKRIPPLSEENNDLDLSPLSQESDEKKHRLDSLEEPVHSLSNFDSQDSKQTRPLSQDSGFQSQELRDSHSASSSSNVRLSSSKTECRLKRRAESADRNAKRIKVATSSDSDSESDGEVSPLVKTISDPSLTVENLTVTKKLIADTAKELDKDNSMCIVCLSEPKSGVFVHGRIAHICCCYKCAVKVWRKAKRCPVCNCKVSNVLRAVVM